MTETWYVAVAKDGDSRRITSYAFRDESNLTKGLDLKVWDIIPITLMADLSDTIEGAE